MKSKTGGTALAFQNLDGNTNAVPTASYRELLGGYAMPSRQNDHEQPADAIAMLKADHQKVRELFQQYEATGDPSAKRNVAEQVFIGARSQGSSP
jgi:hypothetical protein